jgi:asparagine synthase (glutamine-hydrolysing)
MTLTSSHERQHLWSAEAARKLTGTQPEEQLLRAWTESGATNDYDYMIRTDIATYLPGDLLVKADMTSMANSLELRSPLLDHRVVELGLSLPTSMRVSSRGTKIILKQLARDLIPASILDRPKMGFGVPRASWLRGPLRELVRDLLSPSTVDRRGWFNSSTVQSILDAHDGGSDRDNILWPLLMIELWAQTWLDGSEHG